MSHVFLKGILSWSWSVYFSYVKELILLFYPNPRHLSPPNQADNKIPVSSSALKSGNPEEECALKTRYPEEYCALKSGYRKDTVH